MTVRKSKKGVVSWSLKKPQSTNGSSWKTCQKGFVEAPVQGHLIYEKTGQAEKKTPKERPAETKFKSH